MKFLSLVTFIFCCVIEVFAQNPGDTIRVQAFDFESTTRDTLISFPADPTLTYEKILLKYTMRCKDGLVSTGANRNLGCGEWDYSCNTYLVDSTKIEAVRSTTTSHEITNFDGSSFSYSETPVYNYLRGTQYDAQVQMTNSETAATIGTGTNELSRTLSTSNLAGRSQYLYTASELLAGGLTAGNIAALSLNVLSSAGEAQFLKIKIKPSSKSELNGLIDNEGFTEVYYNNTTLVENQLNRFQFYQPFDWDGTSNLIVDFSFNNTVTGAGTQTFVQGETTASKLGLTATNEKELLLTNQGYVECIEYTGVSGSTNRTMEAWVKTNNGSNGEIVSWGTNSAGKKWVFRFVNGRLRLEINGGGTESTTEINDGQWHHVACVLNGNNLGDIEFYVDGVLDENSAVGTNAINTEVTSQLVRISRGVNNRYLDAAIDDVRIWDTNLSEETINEWKSLKVDESHPNFNNLQLDYQFSESGDIVYDSSGNERDAELKGTEYNLTQLDGSTLFKDFERTDTRPNASFYQGDYIINLETKEVDRPILKEPQHFVVERTIESTDPTVARDDIINVSLAQQYWTPEYQIFDEATGMLVDEITLTPDGEIAISELEYFRRFPWYNELVSFVTPYGIGIDFGLEGESWYFDMSDYAPILKRDKRLLMTLGGQWQEEMDLEFIFIVGTPPREVVQFDQIWQGTNRIGSARILDVINNVKLTERDVPIVANGETFKLRSSITGHGSEGEFQQNGGVVSHQIATQGVSIFSWSVHKECSFNPISPQGGTWAFDRQGWCPGERSTVTEHDITPIAFPGEMLNIDYRISNPPVSGGDYRYHVAHQIVGYGSPNFAQDAAVVGIVAPNNTAEYTRVGQVCGNPAVMIRNTGSDDLQSIKINYWLNDSQTPQTYEWTGDLAFMEEELVTIPSSRELWFDVRNNDNVFKVEISNPNAGTDEYPFNNTYQSSFDTPAVSSNNIAIEVLTNNAAFENSYELLDEVGNVIGSNFLSQANTFYSDEYELGAGCFKFSFKDTGNDGIQWWANPGQGSGWVRLRDLETGFTEIFEPDFGGGFEYNLTTDFPLSNDELDFLTSITLYPNPADNYCTIEADDLVNSKIYLTDARGQKVNVRKEIRSDSEVGLLLDDLIEGLYYIVIAREDMVTTRKLVVN